MTRSDTYRECEASDQRGLAAPALPYCHAAGSVLFIQHATRTYHGIIDHDESLAASLLLDQAHRFAYRHFIMVRFVVLALVMQLEEEHRVILDGEHHPVAAFSSRIHPCLVDNETFAAFFRLRCVDLNRIGTDVPFIERIDEYLECLLKLTVVLLVLFIAVLELLGKVSSLTGCFQILTHLHPSGHRKACGRTQHNS